MDKTGLMFAMIVFGAVFLVGTLALVLASFRRVAQGKALIVHKMGREPRVTFSGSALVIPLISKAEVLDLSIKQIRVSCEAVRCGDAARATIDVTFYLRVNATSDDVLRVARSVGCERMSKQGTIEALFVPKLTDAVAVVAAKYELGHLETQRDKFKDQLIEVIGFDLDGFVLDDVAIDRLEPCSSAHDPDGRGRVERSGADELVRLAKDVANLQQQVSRLVDVLAAAKVISREDVSAPSV